MESVCQLKEKQNVEKERNVREKATASNQGAPDIPTPSKAAQGKRKSLQVIDTASNASEV